MTEKQINYHQTIWACDKHRPTYEFVACSPDFAEKVAHALPCPKCHRFGLRMVKQNPTVRYQTTLLT